MRNFLNLLGSEKKSASEEKSNSTDCCLINLTSANHEFEKGMGKKSGGTIVGA